MVSGVFGILWWHVGCLYHCCVTMFAFVAFTIVHEHGGQISVQQVCRFGACRGHVSTLRLHCTPSFVSVAWRGVAWRGVAFQ